jgi:hypothetical protein
MSVDTNNLRPPWLPYFSFLINLLYKKLILRDVINFIWVLGDWWESKNDEKFNFALTTLSLISHFSIFLAKKDW